MEGRIHVHIVGRGGDHHAWDPVKKDETMLHIFRKEHHYYQEHCERISPTSNARYILYIIGTPQQLSKKVLVLEVGGCQVVLVLQLVTRRGSGVLRIVIRGGYIPSWSYPVHIMFLDCHPSL
jgi:hypothetical protein